ncbi:hypothetical protein Tsubulata_034187 [Turnera subulata]|uniref:Peroxisomal multifunctional enzyme type 2-like N-terminal domain-containing protein n=1 Tax=Turnera subulata TaxID=218843 RepID=A0A9Q0F266_9ROSI|nr:hypothetical protein Tsubulata_034187 [Turnera subulata]
MTAIYALGVGACGKDAVDKDELKYVYHENGQQFIQVLPTFPAIFQDFTLQTGSELPGFQYDPRFLLHGQHYIEIYKPLPSSATLLNKLSLAGLHDKDQQLISVVLVDFHPLRTHIRTPPIKKALLYRLSGDYNPLHSDLEFASGAGYAFLFFIVVPLFLHHFHVRYCTVCARLDMPLGQLSNRRPDRSKSNIGKIPFTRLSWRNINHRNIGNALCRVVYQAKVRERNRAVLSGYVELHRLNSSL